MAAAREPRPAKKRLFQLGWFVLIWCLSVAAVLAFASVFRMIMKVFWP
jgi:hypothetical protein